MRSRYLLIPVLGLVLLCSLAQAQERPNILFIFTDDHAYQAISAYGSMINHTPNLDRLAREGMIFHRAMVTNSICAPSRAVIQTGKYSHLNGVLDNRLVFDGTQQTFPKLLRRAGYETALYGKWHLKSLPVGYDDFDVLPGQGHYYNPEFRTPGDGRETVEGYVTDIITDKTIDYLKNRRDKSKPFLMMTQHKAPHRNWMPGPNHLSLYDGVDIWEPPTLFDDYMHRSKVLREQTMEIDRNMTFESDLKVVPLLETKKNGKLRPMYSRMNEKQMRAWDAVYGPKNEAFRKANLTGRELVRWKYQRYIKDYLRCIASVDDNVGKLLRFLDEEGLAENTVVIYSSDQGFYLGEHGWFDKRWIFKESLRTPLIVRWPGVVEPGSVDNHLVANVDYPETMLEIAGAEIPDDMQGRSLVPLLKGEVVDDWRQSFYYHYYEGPNAAHSVARHYGVVTPTHKLVYYYEDDDWDLFDLELDPHEMHSVYGEPQYERVTAELKQELARLRKELKVPDVDPYPEGARR